MVAKKKTKKRKPRHVYCHHPSCGEKIAPRSDAHTCKICKKPFCSGCIEEFGACSECTIHAVAALEHEKNRPDNIKRARAKLAEVEKLKEKLAATRDELRKAYSELEEICTSVDEGVESITSGLERIDTGLDTCSQYI